MTGKAGEYNGERAECGRSEQDCRDNGQVCRDKEQDYRADDQEYKDCEKDYSDEKERGNEKRKAVLWYLERPRRIQKEIRRKQHKINDLRSSLTDIRVSYSDMPKNPSPPASKMEEVLTEVVDLETEIANDKVFLNECRRDIISQAMRLEDAEEQAAMLVYYAQMGSWDEVADFLDKSVWYALEVNKKALKNMETILCDSGKIDKEEV